jgi:hypothetical protein
MDLLKNDEKYFTEPFAGFCNKGKRVLEDDGG